MIQYRSPVVCFALFFVLSTHYVIVAQDITLEISPTNPVADHEASLECKRPNSTKIYVAVYDRQKKPYILQLFTYNVQSDEVTYGSGGWRPRSEIEVVKHRSLGFTIKFTARETDKVRFQCHAEPSTEHNSLDIIVHQPPQVVHLSTEVPVHKRGSVILEGDVLTFKCKIMLGIPKAVDDEFFVPGQLINGGEGDSDTQLEDRFGYITKTMIRKRTLSGKDNLASVKCSARNSLGKAKCVRIMKVAQPVGGVAIKQVTNSVVECSAKGQPAPDITLKVVGNNDSVWQTPSISGTRFVTLTAPELAQGNSYEFNCVASNVVNGETFEKTTTETILIKAPEPVKKTPVSSEIAPAPESMAASTPSPADVMENVDVTSKNLAAQKAGSGSTPIIVGAVCGLAVLAIVVLIVVKLVRKKKS